jgi:hypothetical protein
MIRYLFISILVLLPFLQTDASLFPAGKKSLKVLFVGNSLTFFGNLPQIVSIIAKDGNTRLITRKSVAGGATLSEHWRGEKGLTTREMIESGNFDIVVLQEHSLGAIEEPDTLLKYVRLFSDLIKKKRARPCLFCTWAQEDAPQQQEAINNVYSKAAEENGAEIVPAGNAWALARKLRPEIRLYDTDSSHPSDLGTLLTACVFVEVLIHQLPYNIPYFFYTLDIDKESLLLMHVEKADAAFCRRVAVETVNSR